MNPSARKTIIAAAICASIAAAYSKVTIDAQQLNQQKVLSDIEIRSLSVNDKIPASSELATLQGFTRLEKDKAVLTAYFNNNDATHSPQDIWETIERIENDKQVFAFEALSLKLRWLELNSENEQDFKTLSAQLTAQYQQQYQQKADALKATDNTYHALSSKK